MVRPRKAIGAAGETQRPFSIQSRPSEADLPHNCIIEKEARDGPGKRTPFGGLAGRSAVSQQNQELGGELFAIAFRTTPGAVMSAITLNSLVALLTAVFLCLQIGYLGWKWRREWRHARNNQMMAAQAGCRTEADE